MIFVTVGTDQHDFTRLVKEIDRLAPELNEEMIVQLGHTKYEPRNCCFFRFKNLEEMEKLNKKSRIIITHAGSGSIIKALMYGKKPIVVPRRFEYKEHLNDHQMEITRKLAKENKIIPCLDIKELGYKIKALRPANSQKRENKEKEELILYLESILKYYDKKIPKSVNYEKI